MIIKAQNLQVGDEFLTPSNGSFRWYKLVRPIKFKKGSTTHYSQVRCSANVITHTTPGWKVGTTRTRKTFICTGDGHNEEVYVNVNYKEMWLLARNGQKI